MDAGWFHQDPIPQPLVDRYIAAVDGHGVISTGHAALEVAQDLYVSRWPAQEIDHSPEDFRELLRATSKQRCQRPLPAELRDRIGWLVSLHGAGVPFKRSDRQQLRAWWQAYRRDPTYNLANRNCSALPPQRSKLHWRERCRATGRGSRRS